VVGWASWPSKGRPFEITNRHQVVAALRNVDLWHGLEEGVRRLDGRDVIMEMLR